jgi:cyanate permease
MKEEDRRPWFIVAVLFVALVLRYGTILNTVGMFVAPLVKEFHWSRTRASVLTSVIALLSGLIGQGKAAGSPSDDAECR